MKNQKYSMNPMEEWLRNFQQMQLAKQKSEEDQKKKEESEVIQLLEALSRREHEKKALALQLQEMAARQQMHQENRADKRRMHEESMAARAASSSLPTNTDIQELTPADRARDKDLQEMLKKGDEKSEGLNIQNSRLKTLINQIQKGHNVLDRVKVSKLSRDKDEYDRVIKELVVEDLAKIKGNPTESEREYIQSRYAPFYKSQEEILQNLTNKYDENQGQLEDMAARDEYYRTHGTFKGYKKPDRVDKKKNEELVEDIAKTPELSKNPTNKTLQTLKPFVPTKDNPNVLLNLAKLTGKGILQSGIDTATGVANLFNDDEEKIKPVQMGEEHPVKDIGKFIGDVALTGATGGTGGLLRQIAANAAVSGAQGANKSNDEAVNNAVISGGLTGILGLAGKGVSKVGEKLGALSDKVLKKKDVLEKFAEEGVNPPDLGTLVESPGLSRTYEHLATLPILGNTKNMNKIVSKSDALSDDLLKSLTKNIDTTRKPGELLAENIKGKYETAIKPFDKQYSDLYGKAKDIVIPKKDLPQNVQRITKEVEKRTGSKYQDLTFEQLREIRTIINDNIASLSKKQRGQLDNIDLRLNKAAKKDLDDFIEQTLPKELNAEFKKLTNEYREAIGPYKAKEAVDVVKGYKLYDEQLPRALVEGKTPEINKLFGKLGQEEKNLLALNKVFPKGSADVEKSAANTLASMNKLSTAEKNKLLTSGQQKNVDTLELFEKYAKPYRTKINPPPTGAKLLSLAEGGAMFALMKGLGTIAAPTGVTVGARKLLEKPELLLNPGVRKMIKATKQTSKQTSRLNKFLTALLANNSEN